MDKIKKYLNGDVIFGLGVLAVCVWFFINGQKLASVSLGSSIDAGFFPRVLAIIVGLLAVLLIVQGILHPKKYFVEGVEKNNALLMIKTVIIFGLYVALWPYVHFIILTFVFLMAMNFILKRSLKFSIIYSLIMSVGLFYLFANVFKIILN